MATVIHCPLCSSEHTDSWWQDTRKQMNKRPYFRCQNCALIFVPEYAHVSVAQELAFYATHENNPHDHRYRSFLSRTFTPVVERLEIGASGLDFGCGPGPALSLMFEEAGFPCAVYDPHFAQNPLVWQQQYDFITATEVFEHLRAPQHELERLLRVLKPNGVLAIMTQRPLGLAEFSTWRYSTDPTHICFFPEASFAWIANHYGLRIEYVGADVVLLRKPGR